MLEAIKSPMALVNVLFMLAVLFMPGLTDILTPALQVSVVAVINAAVHIYERLKQP